MQILISQHSEHQNIASGNTLIIALILQNMSCHAILLSLLCVAPSWSSHSQPTGDDSVIETHADLAGDIFIGGLFDIFFTKQSVHCDVDSVNVYSVMEMEAVKWSIKRLNDIDFIPGVKLGSLRNFKIKST
jgi:hypothetical protein